MIMQQQQNQRPRKPSSRHRQQQRRTDPARDRSRTPSRGYKGSSDTIMGRNHHHQPQTTTAPHGNNNYNNRSALVPAVRRIGRSKSPHCNIRARTPQHSRESRKSPGGTNNNNTSTAANNPTTALVPRSRSKSPPSLSHAQRTKPPSSQCIIPQAPYKLGQTAHPYDIVPFHSKAEAHKLLPTLPIGTPLFVKRSNREWTYARVVSYRRPHPKGEYNSNNDDGEDEFWNEEKDNFIVVALDEDCETRKFIQREKWYGCIRLVRLGGGGGPNRVAGGNVVDRDERKTQCTAGGSPRRSSLPEMMRTTTAPGYSSREEVNDYVGRYSRRNSQPAITRHDSRDGGPTSKNPSNASQCTSIVPYDCNSRSSSQQPRRAQCITTSRDDIDYTRSPSSSGYGNKSPSRTVSTSLQGSDYCTRVVEPIKQRLSKSVNDGDDCYTRVESTKPLSKSNSLPVNNSDWYTRGFESTKRVSKSNSLPIKSEKVVSSSLISCTKSSFRSTDRPTAPLSHSENGCNHQGSRSSSVVRFECDYPKTMSTGSKSSSEQSSFDTPASILKSAGANNNSKSYKYEEDSQEDETTATTNSTTKSSTSSRISGHFKYQIFNAIVKAAAADTLHKTSCKKDDESTAETTSISSASYNCQEVKSICTQYSRALSLPSSFHDALKNTLSPEEYDQIEEGSQCIPRSTSLSSFDALRKTISIEEFDDNDSMACVAQPEDDEDKPIEDNPFIRTSKKSVRFECNGLPLPSNPTVSEPSSGSYDIIRSRSSNSISDFTSPKEVASIDVLSAKVNLNARHFCGKRRDRMRPQQRRASLS